MYKPSSNVDWFAHDSKPAVMKTSTQEMMEEGRRNVNLSSHERKMLNFQSYPMADASILGFCKQQECASLMTSYQRDYQTLENICPPKGPIDMEADLMLNRIPPTVLGIKPVTESKFMDDQFTDVPQSRKKVDFFRQLRTQHHT